MHVVLCGCQGADCCAEQLGLSFFDAALGELAVVVRGQLGGWWCQYGAPKDFLLCQKEISAGLWVDLVAAWAGALGVALAVTCNRAWGSVFVVIGVMSRSGVL